MSLYSARQVAAIIGVPYSTIDNWARRGEFRPRVLPARGRGNPRLYTDADILAALLRARLCPKRRPTTSFAKLRPAFDCVRERSPLRPGEAVFLATDGRAVIEYAPGREPPDLGPQWLVIDLGAYAAEASRLTAERHPAFETPAGRLTLLAGHRARTARGAGCAAA